MNERLLANAEVESGVSREQYLDIAKKYENNKEVKALVLFTYYGTRSAYIVKGFYMGVTIGLLAAAIIATIVSIVSN